MIFKNNLFIIFSLLFLWQAALAQDLSGSKPTDEQLSSLDDSKRQEMEREITKAEKEQEERINKLIGDFIILRQDVMEAAMNRIWPENKFFFIPGQRLTPIFP